MNEQIKELIEKAYTRSTGYAGISGYPIVKFDKEKFAELIVKECLKRIENEDDRFRISGHFGVEE